MMGASLATQAYVMWAHLADRPHRLLVHMALVSLDGDAKPKYFGGREAMVAALGLPENAPTSHQMVSRAIRQLIDAGAIRRANVGRVGQRSEYFLTLGRYPKKKGDSSVILRVTQESSGRVTPESSEGDSSVNQRVTVESPQGTTRGTTEEYREEQTTSRTQVKEAATSGEAKADSSQPRRSSESTRLIAIKRARTERSAS